MLSAAELADMQATATGALPDVCVVNPAGSGSFDADGSWIPGSGTTVTVACRVSPAQYQAQERPLADQLQAFGQWTVTLPAGTAVAKDATITSGGRTFSVVGVAGPRSWELARRVFVELRG